MSDVFNHGLDALNYQENYLGCLCYSNNKIKRTFIFNSHKKIEYDKLLHETEKSYLLFNELKGETWIPKSKSIIDVENKCIRIEKWLFDKLEWK